MESIQKTGLGLVLSGGGVKGMVHAGVLKFLKEEGIKPKVIAGASIGAMVGALYAEGHDPEDILRIFQEASFFKTDHISFRKPGIINSQKLKVQFQKHFKKDDFSSLSIPLYATATEITKGRMKIFHEGPLVDALLASSAFPLVFTPVEIDGNLYLDGGIMNHFPADVLEDKCDRKIGIYLTPIQEIEKDKLTSIPSVVERTFRLGRLATSVDRIELVDLLINPSELVDYNTFTIRNKNYRKLFDLGYQYAVKHGDAIKEIAGKTS